MKINSRSKGKKGELELSHLLQDYGYETRRGQQFSGANGDADVEGLLDVHIECKRVERLNIDKAMEQSRRDAKVRDLIPTVFHRKNRKTWLVTMDLSDWIKFYNAYEVSLEN